MHMFLMLKTVEHTFVNNNNNNNLCIQILIIFSAVTASIS